jgi:hypothetical protein
MSIGQDGAINYVASTDIYKMLDQFNGKFPNTADSKAGQIISKFQHLG